MFQTGPQLIRETDAAGPSYTLRTAVIQGMSQPSELFRFLNLTAAQGGSQLQTSPERERAVVSIFHLLFFYPTFSLKSKQYITSRKKLIPATDYPTRVYNVLFPLALLLLLFNPIRLESTLCAILT